MKPVFIFGCDRSGTTLLGSLLGSHSRCVTTPESQFVYEMFRGFRANLHANLHADEKKELETAASRIKNHFRFKLWNIDFDPNAIWSQGVTSYPELILFLVKTYAAGVEQPGADIWVDHTPANCSFAVTLAELFPEAKFIHIVRDGRAVASSLMALPWKFHNARKVSDYWVKKVGQGLAAESHFGPDRCVRVKYEDLVAEPEGVLQKLSAFAGLDYQPQMVTGSGFAVPDYTVKEHALVGKPADPQRINAWEGRLKQRDVEIFENNSGNMLAYLGYTPKYGIYAKREKRSERYLATFLDNFFYKRFDGFKERRKRKQTLATLRAEGYLNRARPESGHTNNPSTYNPHTASSRSAVLNRPAPARVLSRFNKSQVETHRETPRG